MTSLIIKEHKRKRKTAVVMPNLVNIIESWQEGDALNMCLKELKAKRCYKFCAESGLKPWKKGFEFPESNPFIAPKTLS